ncbi:LysE/ArgO family amino acid transporter [Alicyclobacillus macrosporangiidus]|uniref:L-lysine exporter family protein LysE/ArgO n=1 Tax=Alicyclobacillus macrosporangiidus TaxID=392015 RepID=A0A1I7KZS1_9BACL|nr:LysE family transporter [Alicyclobacillus macrosporangiidus]SFV03002.1 L-lysine exporter family protein LysE/ArgO [Alicyclobacillus macrosporangiidus]
MLVAFVHGFLLSLGLILPIGMQNGFILTQGALHRRWAGTLPAVLTAAVCDTLLIALAVMGVSAVALHIRWLRYTFGAIGIAFLLYMGASAWRENQGQDESAVTTAWTVRRQMVFTASGSLLNPHALIDTLAVVGGSAAAYPAWPERIAFGVASVLVSWLWFFSLSIAGHLAGRALLGRSSLRVLNRVSAVMMWASAVYLAYIIWHL